MKQELSKINIELTPGEFLLLQIALLGQEMSILGCESMPREELINQIEEMPVLIKMIIPYELIRQNNIWKDENLSEYITSNNAANLKTAMREQLKLVDDLSYKLRKIGHSLA